MCVTVEIRNDGVCARVSPKTAHSISEQSSEAARPITQQPVAPRYDIELSVVVEILDQIEFSI